MWVKEAERPERRGMCVRTDVVHVFEEERAFGGSELGKNSTSGAWEFLFFFVDGRSRLP